jgi:hypothetical protein
MHIILKKIIQGFIKILKLKITRHRHKDHVGYGWKSFLNKLLRKWDLIKFWNNVGDKCYLNEDVICLDLLGMAKSST